MSERWGVLVLNQIAAAGLSRLPAERYRVGKDVTDPAAILVRSADLHKVTIADSVRAIGRAGAGTNNIPVAAMSARGVPVFNAPGANANAVKELVLAGMLMAARNIAPGAAVRGQPGHGVERPGQGGRRRQEGLCRLRAVGPDPGHHRPGQDRLPGGRCGHQAGHAGDGFRPPHHRGRGLEPALAGQARGQRQRRAAQRAVRHLARAADGQHAPPGERRQHRPGARRRGADELQPRRHRQRRRRA